MGDLAASLPSPQDDSPFWLVCTLAAMACMNAESGSYSQVVYRYGTADSYQIDTDILSNVGC